MRSTREQLERLRSEAARFDRLAGLDTPELSLSVEHDIDLGGAVFKGGYPMLHADGGASVLGNTALGVEALASVTPGVGYGVSNVAVGALALTNTTVGEDNTAVGAGALRYNISGDGNTAVGRVALHNNSSGWSNTAVGVSALFANQGDQNTGTGFYSLSFNSDGESNSAFGAYALRLNTSGSFNTAVGVGAMNDNDTGDHNTAIGYGALGGNVTGRYNVAIGDHAGFSTDSASNNIWINHPGSGLDQNTLRIGAGSGTGDQKLNRAFIHGIWGVTTGLGDPVGVLVDSNGQLGTVASSRRYKRDIEDLGDRTGALMDLRPVKFRYRAHESDPDAPVRYGLIAEEVADVYPELVAYDDDGLPETVIYHLLTPMLLNELQRQRRVIDEQESELERLRGLASRVARIERELAALGR